MTNEQIIEKVWNYSVVVAAIVVSILIIKILSGLYAKNGTIVRTSIKYLVNTTSFLFVYVVYFSFFIVVKAPYGKTKEESIEKLYDWVKHESLEWFYWALIFTLILFLFNKFYQTKIEKIKNNQQLFILVLFNLIIMIYGIIIGSYQAFFGLIGEIDRHTF